MIIRLKNIGIIADSSINLNGLTVITGRNNSGKSTVGKTIYSLIDSVSNIQQKAKADRDIYLQKKIYDIRSNLELLRFFNLYEHENSDFLNDYPVIHSLINGDSFSESTSVYAKSLLAELISFSQSGIEKIQNLRTIASILFKTSDSVSVEENIKEQIQKSIDLLNQAFIDINQDKELVNYTKESINQTLRVEFSGQIQPVSVKTESAYIELKNEKSIYFSINIENNHIIDDSPVFYSAPYRKAYLIDDPFVIDEQSTVRWFRVDEFSDSETFLDIGRIYSHNEKLRRIIRNPYVPSILESTVINKSLNEIISIINQVVPGSFEKSSRDEYYVQNGAKLKVSNLATGSKLFFIIKILLEKGEINDNTMLIIDEPEAHLHPEWQNVFAEIIVLLVKHLDVNVLLTSHSPNFVLAVDAFMRKYKIEEKTNFYQTIPIKEGLVNYQIMNDDMEGIYDSFLEYLSEVKILRDHYLKGNKVDKE